MHQVAHQHQQLTVLVAWCKSVLHDMLQVMLQTLLT